MSHRLFIAIRPPRAIRDTLLAAMDGVAHARWQDDDQLHLTLRFVGDVDGARADDLALALTRLRTAPFPLSVRGVGTFAKRSRVHTLWAEIAPSPDLVRLQARIERLCQAVGLPPERRKFAPHITLARLNAASGEVGPFLARHGDLATPCWQATHMALYESHLGSGGSRYEEIIRVPFDE